MGQGYIGGAYALEGDLQAAVENGEKGVAIAADPFYAEYGSGMLGRFYLLNNQIEKGEKSFCRSLKFGEKFRIETLVAASHIFLGVIHIASGHMNSGLKLLKKGQRACAESHMICEHCLSEYLLGNVYLQIVLKPEPITFLNAAKNIRMLR